MAGTVVGTFTRVRTNVGRPKAAKLELLCTADAALATYPSTIINDLAALKSLWDLRGMMLKSLMAIPSAVVAPTDKVNITIKNEYGVDLLGGAGTQFIPAAGSAWTKGTLYPVLITGDITMALTDNLVNSAVITLVLELVGT